MQLAIYVVYEVLVRLKELNPEVGEYLSYKKVSAGIAVNTTTGTLNISDDILSRQFHNPELVSRNDLIGIAESFEPFRKKQA